MEVPQLLSTMLDFEHQFKTEADCLDFLRKLKWPDGFRCPKCSHTEAWETSSDRLICCQCQHKSSLTAGTIFHQTRKPLMLWFRAMWYITQQKNGVSALGLQRTLGLGSYHTAWTWMHKLRSAMVRPDRDRLSGTVEVDEAYYGGIKKGKRGRGAEGKALILIAVEDKAGKPGRIRLAHIEDASGPNLLRAIKEAVEPKSCIRTDGWKGYNALGKADYEHEIVDRESALVGENLLPMDHLVASLLKRWILGTHQGAIAASHLGYYLDEFTFRFNRRTSKSRGLLFQRLVEQAVMVDPLMNTALKGGNYEKRDRIDGDCNH
jgi:transposase-like protein